MSNGLLLDTNIISIFSPDRKEPSDEIRTWFRDKGDADALYISAITVSEIEKGMRNLHRRGGVDRARRLNAWLDFVLLSFGDRILNVDPVVARIAGALEDSATAKGLHPGLGDVIIAATAKAYSLTVITKNLKHFMPLGVACDLPTAFRHQDPDVPKTPRF